MMPPVIAIFRRRSRCQKSCHGESVTRASAAETGSAVSISPKISRTNAGHQFSSPEIAAEISPVENPRSFKILWRDFSPRTISIRFFPTNQHSKSQILNGIFRNFIDHARLVILFRFNGSQEFIFLVFSSLVIDFFL